MTVQELFEERAGRGAGRGATRVWTGAHRQVESREPVPGSGRSGSTVWFRLALGFCVLVFGLIVAQWVGEGASLLTSEPPSDVEGAANLGLGETEGEPKRILVEGMSLVRVTGPFDPDPSEIDRLPSAQWQVFADSEEPFGNPIVGLEILDGGGFRPWGANLGNDALSMFTRHLVRDGDQWAMDPDSGLVEVATFTANSEDVFEFGWQVDFERGSAGATWQADPHNGNGVWVWLVRLLGQTINDATLTESTILDMPAIVISSGAADNIVWVDGDFVYRLTADEIRGDTSIQRPATGVAPQLHIVDQAEWEAAVTKAESVSIGSVILIGLQLVAVLASLASSVYFLLRGPRWLALLGPAVVFFSVAYTTSSDPITLWIGIALAVAWGYRKKTIG